MIRPIRACASQGWRTTHSLFGVGLGSLGPLAGASCGPSIRHQGRRLDVTGCQLMRLKEGRISEVQGHYSDQYALDAFWKAG